MTIFSHVPNREHENLRRKQRTLPHGETKDGFLISYMFLSRQRKGFSRRVSAHCMKQEKGLALGLHGFTN